MPVWRPAKLSFVPRVSAVCFAMQHNIRFQKLNHIQTERVFTVNRNAPCNLTVAILGPVRGAAVNCNGKRALRPPERGQKLTFSRAEVAATFIPWKRYIRVASDHCSPAASARWVCSVGEGSGSPLPLSQPDQTPDWNSEGPPRGGHCVCADRLAKVRYWDLADMAKSLPDLCFVH
jgi:hypothetical protein